MNDSVEDIFEKNKSIEKMYAKETARLGWIYTDVLFSFRGIYVIGLSVFCQDCFEWHGNVLKPIYPKPKNPNQKAYSRKYLYENYHCYKDLNELEALKNFIKVYRTLGNLIPIWPGGNVHRGQTQCYDLPNIYFNNKSIKRYSLNFFNELCEYKDSEFDKVINGKYGNMKVEDLHSLTKSEYIEFLRYITTIIENREKQIRSRL